MPRYVTRAGIRVISDNPVKRAEDSAHAKVYGMKGLKQATIDRAKAIEAGLSPAKARAAKLNIGKPSGPSYLKYLRSGRKYTQQ